MGWVRSVCVRIQFAVLCINLGLCGSASRTSAAPVESYRVVAQYPHATTSYTEGLFYLDGLFYEEQVWRDSHRSSLFALKQAVPFFNDNSLRNTLEKALSTGDHTFTSGHGSLTSVSYIGGQTSPPLNSFPTRVRVGV